MRTLTCLLLLVLLVGCKDSRTKRASSLAKNSTDVAKAEFESAPTLERKNQIAQEHFNRISPLLTAIDDYLHGRKPATVPPLAPLK